MKISDLDAFTRDFLAALLWSEMDESDESGGEPLDQNYDLDDIAPEALVMATEDCRRFQELAATELAQIPAGTYEGTPGYDFAMTRNEHGVGFWDRDLGDLGDRLTAHCRAFAPFNLYPGDPDENGERKIHASNG